MIPVYENGEIIGQVSYNDDLDFWDGNDWSCGSTGRHKGLTRLKKTGKYVLIYGSQRMGEKNRAEVISAQQAVLEILKSGNESLFDDFPELVDIAADTDSD